jgi:DNA-binding transcriptional LysR family regulator
MKLDLESLRTFVSVVERGSFAAAAGGVHKSQPAITQRIRGLEDNVGKPLFTKSGRRKVLSDDGLRLYEYARRLVSLHDEACKAMANPQLHGDIRLGSPDDVSDAILPSLLRRFSTSFPNVKIVIHVARSAFLMDAMKKGDIDMAVSTRDDPAHPRTVLRTVPTVWISAADFRLDPNLPLPLVMHDEPSLFRTLALEALARSQRPYRINYISPSLAGIRAAVRAGLGITARSVEMLNSDFRVLAEAEGLPRMPDVNFYLYLASMNANPIARELFDLMNTELF